MLALLVAKLAFSHGAMVHPKPRNSIDGALPIFDLGGCSFGPNSTQIPAWCYSCNCGSYAPYNTTGGVMGQWDPACKPGSRAGMSGQSCLWFSNGCSIGCKTCTNGMDHTGMAGGKPLCANPTMNATLPKKYWTMNRFAEPGSAADVYSWHPWRAPGAAPVADACGMAGGMPHAGGGASVFAEAVVAQGFGAPTTLRQGLLGSKVLKKGPAAATWSAGETVEVSWGIRANHGGGYQYRLCPAEGNPNDTGCTEACFQQTPLAFSGQSQIRYNDGTLGPLFDRTEVTEGVTPAGSTWAMNPIPRIQNKYNAADGPGNPLCKGKGFGPNGTGAPLADCRQFVSPACSPEDDDPSKWRYHPGRPGPSSGLEGGTWIHGIEGRCSGDFIGGQIVDHVVIPKDLPKGDWVVGFRWDCEQSAQIWASCADVTIN